jgi:hypothetical protein
MRSANRQPLSGNEKRRGIGMHAPFNATLSRWAIIALLVAACTVRFISRYDPITDDAISKLQQQTDQFIDKMSMTDPPSQYADAKPSYDAIRAGLQSVIQRNDVRDHNDLSRRQLGELQAALARLEQQHKSDGTLPKPFWAPAKDSLDQIFRALIKLELAKKEGTD